MLRTSDDSEAKFFVEIERGLVALENNAQELLEAKLGSEVQSHAEHDAPVAFAWWKSWI